MDPILCFEIRRILQFRCAGAVGKNFTVPALKVTSTPQPDCIASLPSRLGTPIQQLYLPGIFKRCQPRGLPWQQESAMDLIQPTDTSLSSSQNFREVTILRLANLMWHRREPQTKGMHYQKFLSQTHSIPGDRGNRRTRAPSGWRPVDFSLCFCHQKEFPRGHWSTWNRNASKNPSIW